MQWFMIYRFFKSENYHFFLRDSIDWCIYSSRTTGGKFKHHIQWRMPRAPIICKLEKCVRVWNLFNDTWKHMPRWFRWPNIHNGIRKVWINSYLDIYTYSNPRQASPIILGRPYLEFYHMVQKDATRPAPQFGSGWHISNHGYSKTLLGLKTATEFDAAHLMPTCVSKTYNCLFFIVEIWS